MRKILVSVLLVVVMLAVTAGVAAAQLPVKPWEFKLDSNPPGQYPTAINFQITYESSVPGNQFPYKGADFFLVPNAGNLVIGSGPGTSFTMALTSPFPVFGYTNEAYLTYYTPPGGPPNVVYLNPGDTLATLTLSAPGTISWHPAAMPFCYQYWDGAATQIVMGPVAQAQGDIMPNTPLAGDPALTDPAPAPPIVEIVTIVLVSMGLMALGGYIWYRRRRKAALTVA